MNKTLLGIIALILVFSAWVRFYRLGELPVGLYWDEVAIGYDAFSIAKTGLDHTGSIPLTYLESFGDYKNPLYVYLTSLTMIGTTQPTEIQVRIVSALAGIIGTLGVIVLGKLLFRSLLIGAMVGMVYAISPLSIVTSRAGFEANLFLALLIWGLVTFLAFIQTKRSWFLILSVCCFGLSLYSYHSAKVIIPLLLPCLLWIYLKSLNKTKRIIILALIVFCVFLIPFFTPDSIANTRFRLQGVANVGEEEQLHQFHLWSTDTIPRLTKVFHSPRLLMLKNYARNAFANLSADFLLFEGDKNVRHKAPGMGQLYWYELITILLGLMTLFKNSDWKKTRWLILALIPISILPSVISVDAPHALRSITLLIPLSLLSGLGIHFILNWILHQENQWLKKGAYGLVALVLLFHWSYFMHHYFGHYHLIWKDWQYGYRETVQYLKDNHLSNRKIILSNAYAQAIWYWSFYAPVDPAEFQREAIINPGVGGRFWELTGQIGSVQVVPEEQTYDYLYQPGYIVISRTNNYHPLTQTPISPILATIYAPDETPVFYVFDTNLIPVILEGTPH